MTEKLRTAFENCMRAGVLAVDIDHIIEYLNNNGYELGSEKRDKMIDDYMKVTNDPVLSTLIPELSSYDLANSGTNIETLYAIRKRELGLQDVVSKEEKTEEPVVAQAQPVEQAPVAETSVEQPNQGFVDDIKKIKEKIEQTQKIMVQEPEKSVDVDNITPSVVMPNKAMENKKALKKTLAPGQNLTPTGFANVVLMSIIVIIIVAIICVFIFM